MSMSRDWSYPHKLWWLNEFQTRDARKDFFPQKVSVATIRNVRNVNTYFPGRAISMIETGAATWGQEQRSHFNLPNKIICPLYSALSIWSILIGKKWETNIFTLYFMGPWTRFGNTISTYIGFTPLSRNSWIIFFWVRREDCVVSCVWVGDPRQYYEIMVTPRHKLYSTGE